MAHICPDCKLTFENRVPNCPKCGYATAHNTQNEEFYLEQGYVRFTYPNRHDNTSAKINDADILKHLRDGYNTSTSNTGTPTLSQSSINEQPLSPLHTDESSSTSANSETYTPIEINIPDNLQPDFVPSTPSRFEETTETVNTHPLRSQLSNWFHRISSRATGTPRLSGRAFFYIILFIAIIALIAIIWSFRFDIYESILRLASGIFIIAIMIFGAISILRSIIRR